MTETRASQGERAATGSRRKRSPVFAAVAFAGLCSLGGAALTACSSGPPGPTNAAAPPGLPGPTTPPEGVVRAWLDALDEAPVSATAKAKAFALLAAGARQNLDERAKRSSLLLGRRAEPADMFAAGLLGLQFRPKRFVATNHDGDRVDVVVTGNGISSGAANEGERAVFSCVRESEGWRIDVAIPPLPQQLRH